MTIRKMLLGCAAVLGLTGGAGAQQPLSLQYVPDGAAAIAAGHPRALMMADGMELLPRELIAASTLDEIGVDLTQLEQIVAFVTPPINGPPAYGVVARFAKAVALPRLPDAEAMQIGGKPALQIPGPAAPAILLADDKTLLLAPAPVLPGMLSAEGPDSQIAQIAVAASRADNVVAVADIASVRPLAMQALRQAPPLPPQLQPLLKLPEQVDVLAVRLSVAGGRSDLMLRCADDDAAGEALTSITDGLAFGKMMAKAMAAKEAQQEDEPMRSAMLAYVDRIADVIERQLTPTRQGVDLRLSFDAQYSNTAVMVALLLPAVQSAREAARRMSAANNLKMIGLAMHNYHDTHNSFPPRYSSKDGKPLLSWRVHLLPYIDEQPLYDQFHLDEPWDSEHNLKLAQRLPAVYANPNRPNDDGKTVFLAIDADGALLDDEKGVSLSRVTDGSSQTIMAVEADPEMAVIWTKPSDLPFKSETPLRGLGNLRPQGFQVLLADGAVKFISSAVDLDMFRAMVTRAGNEVIPRR